MASGQSTLDPHSPAARDIATLWWWMLAIACIVFSGAIAMLGLAWARRRREGLPPLNRARRNLAAVVVFGIVIPVSVNVALFFVANFVVMDRRRRRRRPGRQLTIQVTGRQWYWEVRYPGTPVVTANEIHIPARTPVNDRGDDRRRDPLVLGPAAQPQGRHDPRAPNRVELYADKPGVYRGQCAEFCGLEHAHMAMYVYAETPAGSSNAWLRAQAAPARRAQPDGSRDPCASCHTIRGTDARGDVGPDLTHLVSRGTLAGLTMPNDRASLPNWLRDPQHVKPGNHMPDLGPERPPGPRSRSRIWRA